MALLAETLIDEWLNRQGFMTMRGVKNSGVDEIDLLGVRRTGLGVQGWHVEAQISFRPVGYITKLTMAYAKTSGKSRTSAIQRPPELLRECVTEFIANKFDSPKKKQARERVWPGLDWKRLFIHAVVKEDAELEFMREGGIEVLPFYRVLKELSHKSSITGAAGTDISEIIQHFALHSESVRRPQSPPSSANPADQPPQPS